MGLIVFILTSVVLTAFFIKPAIWLSHRWGFFSQPRDRQGSPMPVLGGLALFLSIGWHMVMITPWDGSPMTMALVGGIAIFIVGVLDDKWTLPTPLKIAAQLGIITWLFFNGVRIDFMSWPGSISPVFFSEGWAFIITLLWLFTAINMINIMDGIDGLASGISCIMAMILLGVSLSVSPAIVSYLLAAMVGSTGVFLTANFHPARIYMGDSGSLLLGYLFGIVSILGVLKSTVSVFLLLFIFAVPFMDIFLSIYRRFMARKNIFNPDLGHIHHQLVRRGMSVPKTAMLLWGLTIGLGLLGVSHVLQPSMHPLMIGLGVLVMVAWYFFRLQQSQKRYRRPKLGD